MRENRERNGEDGSTTLRVCSEVDAANSRASVLPGPLGSHADATSSCPPGGRRQRRLSTGFRP